MTRYEFIWILDGSTYVIEGDDFGTLVRTLSSHVKLVDYCDAEKRGEIKLVATAGRRGYELLEYVRTSYGSYPRRLGILELKKKELSDRCPKCYVAGVWGARANLICPICKKHLGGLS